MRRNLFLGLFVLQIICSCVNHNIVRDAPIVQHNPGVSLRVEKDSTFNCSFPQTISCVDLMVIDDSVLVLYDAIIPGRNSTFFKAYLLDDYSYIGEYVVQGRGPGELLCPDLSGCYQCNGETRCYVLDIMLGQSYSFNLRDSANMNSLVKISDLPDNSLYAYPYQDSLQFVVNVEDDQFRFNVLDKSGSNVRKFSLYPENISAEKYLPQLGNSVAVNSNKGIAALVMLGIPQINYFNLESGTVYSIATDKKYRDWRNLISAAADVNKYMKATQYYANAASSRDYVFALYSNRSIEDIMHRTENGCPHIHIFDWEGTFLYDITVDEDISRIDYDSKRKNLYGVNINTNEIFRYDLSGLL